MKALTSKEFTSQFVQFLKELTLEQNQAFRGANETFRLTDDESIVDLFRLWFMDSREAELIEHAKKEQDERGYDDGY
jgi:hypothetical protein